MATSKFTVTHVACILFLLDCMAQVLITSSVSGSALTTEKRRRGRGEVTVLVEHTAPVGRVENKQINNRHKFRLR